MLRKIRNQQSKFRTKSWVQINNDAYEMLKSSLCSYSDTYILVSGTITIDGDGADDNAKRFYERNKRVIFKNCAPFTDCRSKIDNTQIDNAKDLDVAMPMYSLIEYSDNYL